MLRCHEKTHLNTEFSFIKQNNNVYITINQDLYGTDEPPSFTFSERYGIISLSGGDYLPDKSKFAGEKRCF